MKRSRKLWLSIAVLLSPILLCGSIVFGPFAYQQYRMWRFSRPFFNYPLPPKTEEIARDTSWGLLTGNGHHCDFRASRTLTTDLTRDEIETYYEEAGFPALNDESQFATLWGINGLVSVDVKFQDQLLDNRILVEISIFDGLYDPIFLEC